MMHVAIAGWLGELGPSGANRRQRGLVRAAVAELRPGERITWLAASPPEGLPGVGFHRVEVPPRPTWRRALRERRILPDVLGELGASVLDLQSLPVAPRLPCAVCLTIHDLRDLTEYRRRPAMVARTALRRSLARAAHVVVPSAFTAACLRDAGADNATPTTIVPGGVDQVFFDGAARPLTEDYFLHVGHLEPRKNLGMLVDAYARLCERAGEAPRLVLVGADRGEAEGLRRRAAGARIADRVVWRGRVADEELPGWYAGATAVVVPSRYEGFGLPALEGLAAGRPVLVSDCGALPEVVGAAGIVLPAGDADAWAAAMAACARVHRDDARQERAREFGWATAAVRLVAIWRGLS